MRVFVAGASGAIGRALVPALLAAGHEVIGTSRSEKRAREIRATGAQAVTCDALDAQALEAAVARANPDAIVHELTALPQRIRPRHIERDFALNDRLRVEGTRNLVAAAAGRPVIAQSIAFMYEPGPPGTIHTEDDPQVDPAGAPQSFRRSAAAAQALEQTVLDCGGLVLRYGYLYGDGTAIAREGSVGIDARRRMMPIVGGGGGVWSLVHIDDAASATVAALGHQGPRVYNIVDDEPAAVRDWLPAFARAVGAPRPARVPAWLGRLAAGEYGLSSMTLVQGASNARARQELGFEPRYPSWRTGFETL